MILDDVILQKIMVKKAVADSPARMGKGLTDSLLIQ